jgi:protein-tyrosine phosphatase
MAKHGANINFSKISNYIYIGTNACCQIHFDKKLLKKGVQADLSLEKERIDQPWGVKYFLWLPTTDMTPPNPKQLEIGVNFIKSLIKNKTKVYIHCKNGHGRAPTMAAAYFISTGMSVKEAMDLLKKKRPEVHLNTKQVNALKLFKKKHG